MAKNMAEISNLSIIKVSNLSKHVLINDNELHILSDIGFSVKPGESIAIVGASGSGKSTLLSLLAGLDLPSSGEIFLDGAPIHQFNEEQRAQLRGQSVGFIFQAFMLVQSLTALENVMLPAELAGMDNAKQLAEDLLARVGLGDRTAHFPNQLSGGEQQRVAIARAFITKPKILFADEPSANLDSKNGHLIEDLLFELNQQYGATLVLVTHDPQLASRCQRILTMHDGQLNEEASQEEPIQEEQAHVV
ncbi:MAG: putative ABC transport system ATP-binding protein [Phenylobacterium sp.]|jgi:putative ABC transport system ATP-binding protein